MSSAPRNLLIVEGIDDRYFINQILLRYGFRKSPPADRRNFIVDRQGDPEKNAIRIHECSGFENISRALKAELQPETLDGLAIIAEMDLHTEGGTLFAERRPISVTPVFRQNYVIKD